MRILGSLCILTALVCTFTTHPAFGQTAPQNADQTSINFLPFVHITSENFPKELGGATLAFNKGDFDDVIKQLDAYHPGKRDYIPLSKSYFLRGLALVGKGDLSSADETFQKSLSYRRTDSSVLYSLAMLRLQLAKPLEARALLEEALFFIPSSAVPDSEIAVRLAFLYRQEKRASKALQAVNIAIQKDPTYVPALTLLSEIQKETGGRAEALKNLRAGVAKDPNNVGTKLALAELLLAGTRGTIPSPEIKEAKELSESVLNDTAPLDQATKTKASLLKIRSLIALGDLNEAKSALSFAQLTNKDNTDVRALAEQIEVEEAAISQKTQKPS